MKTYAKTYQMASAKLSFMFNLVSVVKTTQLMCCLKNVLHHGTISLIVLHVYPMYMNVQGRTPLKVHGGVV